MANVSVTEAKDKFSKVIDRAHYGEEVVILKHGKPYARLIPLASTAPRRSGTSDTA